MRKFRVAYTNLFGHDVMVMDVILYEGEKANVKTFVEKLIELNPALKTNNDLPWHVKSWSLIEE